MHQFRLFFAAAWIAVPLVAYPQSNVGVTVIDNPGGRTIAYALMPAQHSVQGAMGRLLQYAQSRFGARPQIVRVMRGADGNSRALTFTVQPTTGGSGEMAGLALVVSRRRRPLRVRFSPIKPAVSEPP